MNLQVNLLSSDFRTVFRQVFLRPTTHPPKRLPGGRKAAWRKTSRKDGKMRLTWRPGIGRSIVMPLIRPISDLRNNFAEISRIVHETSEPIFLTKNGYGDMVVMSVDLFERLGIAATLLEQKSKSPGTAPAPAVTPVPAPAAEPVSASAPASAAEQSQTVKPPLFTERTPIPERDFVSEKSPGERIPVSDKIQKPLSMWQKTLSELSDLTPKELDQDKAAAADGSDHANVD